MRAHDSRCIEFRAASQQDLLVQVAAFLAGSERYVYVVTFGIDVPSVEADTAEPFTAAVYYQEQP